MPIASRENYSNVNSYEAPTGEMPVVTQDVIEGEQARIDSINRERGENGVDTSYQDSMDQDSAVFHEINSLVRVSDSFKKIVVVRDNIMPWHDENGILYIGIEDFLLEPESLDK